MTHTGAADVVAMPSGPSIAWIPLPSPSSGSAVSAPMQSDLLYIMYTSGSTGRPLGVLGTHTGDTDGLMVTTAMVLVSRPIHTPDQLCPGFAGVARHPAPVPVDANH